MKKFKRLLIIILVIFAITSCKNSKIIENDNVNYCFFYKKYYLVNSFCQSNDCIYFS
jgi:hypothetical protein